VTVTSRGGRARGAVTSRQRTAWKKDDTHARTRRQGALAAAAGLKLTPQLLMLLLLLLLL